MPFTLQDPSSGLFWTSGLFGRIILGPAPNTYVLEGSYIKNVETGNYVNHMCDLLHEGGESEEFEFRVDGTIASQGRVVLTGLFLSLADAEGTSWVKVEEVPVPRASALIEEALTTGNKCVCERACDGECEECAAQTAEKF